MNGVIIQVGTKGASEGTYPSRDDRQWGNHCLGVSPETAGDSLFNILRLVSRNMYYRTVVALALIRLLRLVTPAKLSNLVALSPYLRLPIIIIEI